MRARLDEWAGKRGYAAGWYPADAIDRALEHVARLREEGAFDDAFFSRSLSWLKDPGVGAEPGERSVILVAVPRPAHIVTFEYGQDSFDLFLPVTYHDYVGVAGEVRKDLEAFLGKPLRTVRAPLKALAVTTGLARYGRNNVAYVNGFGSYVQLMAFASGVPVDDLAPNGPRAAALDECQGCKACQAACPTGAIARDRFLIRAERCITWFSEYEGPLPDAFGLAKRPCLVGCTACQEACPVNRGLLRLERLGVRFCRAETEFLLGTGAAREAPSGIAAKVEALRCSDCALESGQPIATFRRNLHAVLRHRAAGS